MKRALLFLLLAVGVAAQEEDIAARAERLLVASDEPGAIRELAATLLVRDAARARDLADRLADGDWKQKITALTIWTQLGGRVVLEEAVLERAWDRDGNLALRTRCLESLVGVDLEGHEDRVLDRLDDPVWLVRRAAVRALGPLPAATIGAAADRMARRLDDDIEEIRGLARDVLITAADESLPALETLLARSWQSWRDVGAKRALVRAALDARARGLEFGAALMPSGRGDPFSRALDLAFAEPGPRRMTRYLRIAGDASDRELLGDGLVRALRELAVADEGWDGWFEGTQWRGGRLGEGVLGEIVAAILPRAGRRFRVLAADAAVEDRGREPIEEALLREAFENPPDDLAALLDALFDEIGAQGASRRRLRRIMKLRSALDVPIPEDLLMRGLAEGPFPRRVIVTEQLWRRSDAELRERLIRFVTAGLDELGRAREPILRILVERPREEALGLYEGMPGDDRLPEDLRIKAVDVLLRFDPERSFPAELIAGCHGELRHRLIEQELRPGGIGVEIVAREIAGRALDEIPLDLLRLASRCDFADLDRAVHDAIEAGDFDARRLPAYIDYVGLRFGADRRRRVVEALLERTIDLDPESRQRTAYARMDGKVLEHLIDENMPRLPVARLFRLVESPAVAEADRVLHALARAASRRGEEGEFRALLEARWRLLCAAGPGSLRGAGLDAIARELLLSGEPAFIRLVVAEAERALDACCGRDLGGEAAFEAAVLLESAFQALVESGEVVSAIELLRRCADRLASMSLDSDAGANSYDPRLSMISVLVAETRRDVGASTLGLAMHRLPEARTDPDFWLGWARQSLRFPDAGPFGLVLADRLLELPPPILVGQDHVLRALGARLMSRLDSRLGARLYLVGSRLGAAAPAETGGDDRIERIMLGSGIDDEARFWTEAEARLLEGLSPRFRPAKLRHRRADDRRFVSWLRLARELGRIEVEPILDELHRDGDDFAGIDALRIRVALDAKRYEEARLIARHALQRIAVFGVSERNGDLQSFSAWEAAALWGLDRRDEARLLLKRVGITDLAALRGPRPSDFP